jgi:hypothetical protein
LPGYEILQALEPAKSEMLCILFADKILDGQTIETAFEGTRFGLEAKLAARHLSGGQ